jgi:hypothetical protein
VAIIESSCDARANDVAWENSTTVDLLIDGHNSLDKMKKEFRIKAGALFCQINSNCHL